MFRLKFFQLLHSYANRPQSNRLDGGMTLSCFDPSVLVSPPAVFRGNDPGVSDLGARQAIGLGAGEVSAGRDVFPHTLSHGRGVSRLEVLAVSPASKDRHSTRVRPVAEKSETANFRQTIGDSCK